ncbi:MAG: hypothetical protein DBY36_05825 [Clostridiales bacterium]|nr:MAG: hypothetical protein DBY36_05825 [Clostridiales bacterium]
MITADSSEQVSGEFGAGRIKRRRREKRGAASSRFSIFPQVSLAGVSEYNDRGERKRRWTGNLTGAQKKITRRRFKKRLSKEQ